MRERCILGVEGTVQGAGIRPFVYRLAARHALDGAVRNASGGVGIELEGERPSLDAFRQALERDLPPLAPAERIRLGRGDAIGVQGFSTAHSRSETRADTAIPADICPADRGVWRGSDRGHRARALDRLRQITTRRMEFGC